MNYTIPIFVKKNKKMKISLLHLDLDDYEPSFIALEYFYEKVTPGGIILIDDYKIIRFLKSDGLKISTRILLQILCSFVIVILIYY